jgi:hypothetical protein
VEAQTDMPWLNRADKPTRLTVKTAEQNITASKKATNSSQAKEDFTRIHPLNDHDP